MATTALAAEEELACLADIPILARFLGGRRDRPLVVFLPGGGHLARIAYGHPGSDPKEFLGHWLNSRGFGFLGLSYPGSHPVFSAAHAELSPRQWGAAAAAETARRIEKYGLQPRVVLCVWSMAGRHVHPFTRAAVKLGLTVDVCISLAASAPIPGAGELRRHTLTRDGLWDISRHLSRFLMELFEQDVVSAPFSRSDYTRFYTQNHSMALRADAEHLDEDGSVYIDPTVASEIGIGRWHEYPLCGAIVPHVQRDLRHSLGDHVTWPLITVLGATSRLESSGIVLDDHAWSELRQLITAASQDLTRSIDGGHFFFVGAAGALQTAELIDELWSKAMDLQSRVRKLCGEIPQ